MVAFAVHKDSVSSCRFNEIGGVEIVIILVCKKMVVDIEEFESIGVPKLGK